jgi:hypothetical protein
MKKQRNKDLMKNRVGPEGRLLVIYPRISRRPPGYVSKLQGLMPQIIEMRIAGKTIKEICTWVTGRSGWQVSRNAINRQLAKHRRT